MAVWKYTDKEVSKEDAEKSIAAIKSACFKCDKHSNDCPLAKAVGAISEMMNA